jgi:hypothetical protein
MGTTPPQTDIGLKSSLFSIIERLNHIQCHPEVDTLAQRQVQLAILQLEKVLESLIRHAEEVEL